MNLSDDMLLAHRLAEVAGKTALWYFCGNPRRRFKADGSVVTEADLAVERALVEILAAERPGDAVLAEESGCSATVSERCWIIDPIDGTDAFLAGKQSWGPHVALSISGTLEGAVLARPAAGLRWWAQRGRGAYRGRDGEDINSHRRLWVSQTRLLTGAQVSGLVDEGSTAAAAMASKASWRIDRLSPIVALVEGRIDAVLDEGGDPWDQAPAVLLTLEAGGSYCDPFGGGRFDVGWGLYSNAYLQHEIMTLLHHLSPHPSDG